ncbi:MAG: YfhO family protein, partial [Pseudomonadota bacterium]
VSFHPRLLGDAPGVILSRWGPRWFFDMNYFGVATVVLIFAALLCIRRYKRVSFFFVAFVLYLITIYTYKGLYPQTLGQLPLLSGVRAYAHIYMWVICIAALSAYGVQSQLSSKIGPWGKTIALSIGLVGTVWIAAYLSSFHPILQETVDADPNPSRAVLHWLPTGLLTLALVQHLLSLMRKRAEEQTASLPTESLILAALFVTSYDLLSVSSGVNRTVAEEHYFPTHPAIEKLQAIQGHDKIMPLNNGLPSLVHLPYGIRSIGFRGFFTERARNVVREYAPTFPTDRIATQFNHPPSSTDLAHPFIELMGVKYFTDLTSSYVLDEFDTKEDNSGPYPRVRKIRSEGISIYENLDYSGRAHITPSCIERSEDEMLAEITATRADLTRFVFRKECPSTRLQAGRARIVNEEPGRIGVAIESTGPTILVLGDNYANGWRAEANGEPISVFRANYNFIGIDVPAGTERVVLRYAPTGLWPAIYLAATAWLLLIGGFLYRVFRSTWPQIQKTRKTMMSAASINTRR